jgi:hypothetical protein
MGVSRVAEASPEVTAVGVSGPDNVGKSTQIRLLSRRVSGVIDAGRLDDFDPRWVRAREAGLADWWFSAAPVAEVVDVLARSYLARVQAGLRDGGVRLIDRGIPMLEASIVATVVVREARDHPSAVERTRQLLAPYQQELDRAEVGEFGLLLLHDVDPHAGAARALAREAEVSARYAVFQTMLGVHLHSQAAGGRFAEAITVGDRSILSVQHELGVHLSRLGVRVPDVALEQVQVLALGGLSESGKSTASHYLQARHGYARLKIGYLLQVAAARHRIPDVYALDATALAELLAEVLEEFCAAHHFQRRVAIESLHRAGMTRELVKLLGRRLTVVYMDAEASLREARGVAGPDDVRERDVVKRARGADQVRDIADAVIDNNRPLAALYHALDRMVAGERWPLATPRRTTVADLGLPRHLAGYLEALLDRTTAGGSPLASLLAVTGSGGRGKYQQGWSDLDVLLIADAASLPALRKTLADLAAELQGVKLGLTVASEAECRAGALTPRLLHTLTLIGAGHLPVLWCLDDLRLPHPDAEADAWASLADGVAAAVEIRRLLVRKALDLRSLFKVTALLAKVVLRADGDDHAGDDDALHAFMGRFPELLAGLGAAVVDRAHRDELAAEALAMSVLGCWLATLPAVGETALERP